MSKAFTRLIHMQNFIPGLKLSELFYSEAAKPILDAFFPELAYSAGLLGWGSEVLGYDDIQSSDHHWGPRFFLFLSDEDYKQHKNAIHETLSRNLPHRFRGYSTSFDKPDEVGVRRMSETDSGPVNHMVHIETIESFFKWYLGCNPYKPLTAADWLSFSEHKLLGVTSGKVFHDGLGELEEIRRKFLYYPHDVWLYQLVAQWIKIFEDREFISRCGDVEDELGSMVIAGHQVKKLMRLCFLIERKYAPYTKWFGTAFSELECASELNPIFRDVLLSPTWKERESNLSRAYRIIARMHNALKITRPVVEDVRNYHGRPYMVFDAPELIHDILNSFTDEEVKAIKHGLGSVNQFVDSTNQLSNNPLCEMLKAVYK
ncbi:MAG TPA: DUF4037 domain-containing protein [Pyrinomonadaceae bacterium]|nr:DUF4037 domain-containing protein [Pyrinomonadaceae bacterium]